MASTDPLKTSEAWWQRYGGGYRAFEIYWNKRNGNTTSPIELVGEGAVFPQRKYTSEAPKSDIAPKIEILAKDVKDEVSRQEKLGVAKGEIQILDLRIKKLSKSIDEKQHEFTKETEDSKKAAIEQELIALNKEKSSLEQIKAAYNYIISAESAQYDAIDDANKKLEDSLKFIDAENNPGMHAVAKAIVDYKKGIYGAQSKKAKSDITADVLKDDANLTPEKLEEARKVIEASGDSELKAQFNEKLEAYNKKIEKQRKEQALILTILEKGENGISAENIDEIIEALEANKGGFKAQKDNKTIVISQGKINDLLEKVKARKKAGCNMVRNYKNPAEAIRKARYDSGILTELQAMTDADIIVLCQQDRGTGKQQRENFDMWNSDTSGKAGKSLVERLEHGSNSEKSMAYLYARLAKIKERKGLKLSTMEEQAALALTADNKVKDKIELEGGKTTSGWAFLKSWVTDKLSTTSWGCIIGRNKDEYSIAYMELCEDIGITCPKKGENKDRTQEIRISSVLAGDSSLEGFQPVLPDTSKIQKIN